VFGEERAHFAAQHFRRPVDGRRLETQAVAARHDR
jgi:hypothetical protein